MIMLGGGWTDSQLLDHYVHGQDSSAFQELVSRHGSVVHRVCRGVLKDIHEAEDAFQATFLVLARKAPEIQDPEALGGWLRGVAYRVAIRARRRAARRREIEKARAEIELSRDGPALAPEERASDLKELVVGELSRLPDEYRRPIVLCYLDGLTHQEAARRLDWPVGTVKVRLVRGRRMLRERLSRRGVALGAGLLLLLSASRRACAVTEPLVESTARAMSLAATGRKAALRAEFPRATALADAVEGLGVILKQPWIWAVLVVAAVSLTMSGPVSRAFGGPPMPGVDPSTLPSNLTDVLNVECR
jgi:RNA polymerase sigma factor (sigma-70 family)